MSISKDRYEQLKKEIIDIARMFEADNDKAAVDSFAKVLFVETAEETKEYLCSIASYVIDNHLAAFAAFEYNDKLDYIGAAVIAAAVWESQLSSDKSKVKPLEDRKSRAKAYLDTNLAENEYTHHPVIDPEKSYGHFLNKITDGEFSRLSDKVPYIPELTTSYSNESFPNQSTTYGIMEEEKQQETYILTDLLGIAPPPASFFNNVEANDSSAKRLKIDDSGLPVTRILNAYGTKAKLLFPEQFQQGR